MLINNIRSALVATAVLASLAPAAWADVAARGSLEGRLEYADTCRAGCVVAQAYGTKASYQSTGYDLAQQAAVKLSNAHFIQNARQSAPVDTPVQAVTVVLPADGTAMALPIQQAVQRSSELTPVRGAAAVDQSRVVTLSW